MRKDARGVHQLAQALRDFQAGRPRIREVDDRGAIVTTQSGEDVDAYNSTIRDAFPPQGSKPIVHAATELPTDRLEAAIGRLGVAVSSLMAAYRAVVEVRGLDGEPLVENDGVRPELCTDWRSDLKAIDDELNLWSFRHTKRRGAEPSPEVAEPDHSDDDNSSEIMSEPNSEWPGEEALLEPVALGAPA